MDVFWEGGMRRTACAWRQIEMPVQGADNQYIRTGHGVGMIDIVGGIVGVPCSPVTGVGYCWQLLPSISRGNLLIS